MTSTSIKQSKLFDESKSKSSKVTSVIDSVSRIEGSIRLLHEDEKDDSKSAGTDVLINRPVRISPTPSLIKVARSVFTPGKVYKFRLTRTALLTTSGGGTMNLATNVYPQQFDQYNALVLLFDEARLLSTHITYTDVARGGTLTSAIVTAFDPSEANASPSFAAGVRFPGAKLFCTSQTVWPVHNSWTARNRRPWSKISATSAGTDPTGGIIGKWYHCAATTLDNSKSYLLYLIEAEYALRSVV